MAAHLVGGRMGKLQVACRVSGMLLKLLMCMKQLKWWQLMTQQGADQI